MLLARWFMFFNHIARFLRTASAWVDNTLSHILLHSNWVLRLLAGGASGSLALPFLPHATPPYPALARRSKWCQDLFAGKFFYKQAIRRWRIVAGQETSVVGKSKLICVLCCRECNIEKGWIISILKILPDMLSRKVVGERSPYFICFY